MFAPFLANDALELNKARLDHLASLNLSLEYKKVLEVGAGIGLLTPFFLERRCTVLSVDARSDNTEELRKRIPYANAQVVNLDTAYELTSLGLFDMVFAYGIIYHLQFPKQALKLLATICMEMIIVESLVTVSDEDALNSVEEDSKIYTQSYRGYGCRPTSQWFMHKLNKYFGHAYITTTVPNHKDFKHSEIGGTKRAVFVGSKVPIINKFLSTSLGS